MVLQGIDLGGLALAFLFQWLVSLSAAGNVALGLFLVAAGRLAFMRRPGGST